MQKFLRMRRIATWDYAALSLLHATYEAFLVAIAFDFVHTGQA